ncbi:ESX secretion-associated protein EspG [Pseudonocardia sp. KRD291]|uniref:ESX secretion-associated protein EspG n=1 Tax=Pseudonocardia sp. KRD291 TaxID=2792007 RepID=UPI001C49F238|nr:ESX secretion-associated protein EspG [Pseudonocardia sp. KRD291]MBW0103073.1 ESX secretion-associated protein EspG [Pseudonocardia sp. KRD291]
MSTAADWSRATVLTLVEADVAFDVLGIDTPPPALDPPHHGRTLPERSRIVSGAVAHLRARGLDPGGDSDLARDLRLLARPALSLDLLHRYRALLGAVVAVDGGDAVLAVRHEDEIALLRIPPERAADTLVDLLGPLTPAAGATVRVPARVLSEAVRDAGDDADRLVVELMRRGMTGAAARALVATNHEVDALAQIGSNVRTPTGQRRGPYVLTVQHNAAGHHRQRLVPPGPRRSGSPGEHDVVEAGPIGRTRLLQEVDELVAATLDGAGPGYRRGAGRGSTRPAETGGIGSWTGASTR